MNSISYPGGYRKAILAGKWKIRIELSLASERSSQSIASLYPEDHIRCETSLTDRKTAETWQRELDQLICNFICSKNTS